MQIKYLPSIVYVRLLSQQLNLKFDEIIFNNFTHTNTTSAFSCFIGANFIIREFSFVQFDYLPVWKSLHFNVFRGFLWNIYSWNLFLYSLLITSVKREQLRWYIQYYSKTLMICTSHPSLLLFVDFFIIILSSDTF